SLAVLRAQSDYFRALETIVGRPVTLRDALNAGFPVPLCEDSGVREVITPNTPLCTISEAARNALQDQLTWNPKEVLLDMDGTLYPLDGPKDGYRGSSLERTVNTSILAYVQGREECTEEMAQALVQQALSDPVGERLLDE